MTGYPNNWKKNTALFLASQCISLFGSMLVQYAIVWHITLRTQSAVMLTISILCGFVPMFLLSPFAGVWADKYSRKKLIILADCFVAAATLLLAVAFLLGYTAIWLFFLCSAIRALGTAVQRPAVEAILPQFVPKDKLTRINGLNTSIQTGFELLSPMLSGILLSVFGIASVFFVDVLTAAVAIAVLGLFVRAPQQTVLQQTHSNGLFSEIRAGFAYISNHTLVKTLFLFSAAYFVLIAPLAFLSPLQVARSFGKDVWRLTAIEVVYATGMILGGLLIAWKNKSDNQARMMTTSIFVMALCTFALGVVPVFLLYLAVMGIIGLMMPMFTTPFTVFLQQRVEEQYMGRVFSVLGMIPTFVMPLAMLVYGPIADTIRIEWLLLGTGTLLMVMSLVMRFNRVLRRENKLKDSPVKNENFPLDIDVT